MSPPLHSHILLAVISLPQLPPLLNQSNHTEYCYVIFIRMGQVQFAILWSTIALNSCTVHCKQLHSKKVNKSTRDHSLFCLVKHCAALDIYFREQNHLRLISSMAGIWKPMPEPYTSNESNTFLKNLKVFAALNKLNFKLKSMKKEESI